MTISLRFQPGDRMVNGGDLNNLIDLLNVAIAAAANGNKGDKGDKGDTGDTGAAGTPAANVVTQNQETGVLTFGLALPTTDPGVDNTLWNDLGVVRVSTGNIPIV